MERVILEAIDLFDPDPDELARIGDTAESRGYLRGVAELVARLTPLPGEFTEDGVLRFLQAAGFRKEQAYGPGKGGD